MPRPEPPKLVPAGTPNDGLPEHWQPVNEPPITVGNFPLSGPILEPKGPGQFYAGTIPLGFQLTPDIMPTRYPGGLGGYRIMPPATSANPQTNSAIISGTKK